MARNRFFAECSRLDVGERLFFSGNHVRLMRDAHTVASRYGYELTTRKVAFIDMKTGESEIGVRVERIR